MGVDRDVLRWDGNIYLEREKVLERKDMKGKRIK